MNPEHKVALRKVVLQKLLLNLKKNCNLYCV